MKKVLLLAMLLVIAGCGGQGNGALGGATPVSPWSGTYSGSLNFKGCSGTTPCGGDGVTLTVSQAANPTVAGEFETSLTISGADSTTKDALAGSGITTSPVAADTGPAQDSATATASITPGGSLFFLGSGTSTTSAPAVFQTIQVSEWVTTNGVGAKGAYLGTLTRTSN